MPRRRRWWQSLTWLQRAIYTPKLAYRSFQHTERSISQSYISARSKYGHHRRTWNVSSPSPALRNEINKIQSYFSKYALEEVFLKDSRYAKFINKDLLDKYYPIGGVRIEDDILVTDDGYENLTKVPKGEEALKIINGDWEEVERIEEEKGKWGWFW
jgi:hypothetical protein